MSDYEKRSLSDLGGGSDGDFGGRDIPQKRDMVSEADRIISESLAMEDFALRRERGERKKAFLIPFFLGALVSFVLTLISCLLLI